MAIGGYMVLMAASAFLPGMQTVTAWSSISSSGIGQDTAYQRLDNRGNQVAEHSLPISIANDSGIDSSEGFDARRRSLDIDADGWIAFLVIGGFLLGVAAIALIINLILHGPP